MDKNTLKEAVACDDSIFHAAERLAELLDKMVAEGNKPVVAKEYRKFLELIDEQLEEKYIRGQDSMNRDPYGPM
ncbi:hypothetical protein BSP36_173 [Bacillus phage BSP36]|nr:hypothetical protein BSP36_173 [Bacillus phage BSP36]